MESFGSKPENRKVSNKLEKDTSIKEESLESKGGLGAKFSQLKGRITAMLLAIGIPAMEMPVAHAVEPVPTEVSEKIIGELFPSSVIEGIKEQGFEIKVTLPLSAEGHYLVHVGKLHEATFAGLDRSMLQGQVDKFHQRMYVMYPELIKACNSPSFREGRTYELHGRDEAKKENERLADVLEGLTAIEPTSTETAVELMSKIEKGKGALLSLRNHPKAPELNQALKEAANRLGGYMDTVPESVVAEDADLKMVSLQLEMFDVSATVDVISGTTENFDAPARLFFEEKIDLYGAEDPETNKKAVELFKEAQDAEGRIRQLSEEARLAFERTPDGQEKQRIMSELEKRTSLTEEEKVSLGEPFKALMKTEEVFIKEWIETNAEYKQLTSMFTDVYKVVHDERETRVYERVEKFLTDYPDYGGIGMKCAVVEYGDNHTFADSAAVWNTRPETHVSFGIIEIKDPNLQEAQ